MTHLFDIENSFKTGLTLGFLGFIIGIFIGYDEATHLSVFFCGNKYLNKSFLFAENISKYSIGYGLVGFVVGYLMPFIFNFLLIILIVVFIVLILAHTHKLVFPDQKIIISNHFDTDTNTNNYFIKFENKSKDNIIKKIFN